LILGLRRAGRPVVGRRRELRLHERRHHRVGRVHIWREESGRRRLVESEWVHRATSLLFVRHALGHLWHVERRALVEFRRPGPVHLAWRLGRRVKWLRGHHIVARRIVTSITIAIIVLAYHGRLRRHHGTSSIEASHHRIHLHLVVVHLIVVMMLLAFLLRGIIQLHRLGQQVLPLHLDHRPLSLILLRKLHKAVAFRIPRDWIHYDLSLQHRRISLLESC